MSKYNDLTAILRKMFQLDQADLDFGIYRIMNQKRDEIEQFLDRDLLPQVKTAFAHYEGDDQSNVREELERLRKTLEDAGVVAETSPKYQSLQAQLSRSVDVSALENEVFSQLTNFFRRYYQEGDFLSLRRYKAGVYAIPYEGEEVKLHWANADQYYIKSSENFRDYTFRLLSGKRAHFKLVDASTEQNNRKEQAGKERRFVLCAETPLVEKAGELFIRFEYRVDETGAKQPSLNEAAVSVILAEASGDWKRELSTLAPTAKNPRRTVLEKHLTDYTAKYSFDYFIHKDLGGFLRRELDFFIKNEVLFIDDLDADHIKATISKVKVIKEIGHKIIAFLEQLENFQKKLWLKKKFVVETGYCCTLDKVPEELFPAIIANKAQVEEWQQIFAIQEIEGDLHTPPYTLPLTVEFLKANPFLVLDTAFFDQEFTEKLLASFDNLDEATDGLLVNSENFQALNLLQERLRKQVQCVYIDPPYNTGGDGFVYKDSYRHSSWLSMITDRLRTLIAICSNESVLFSSIDDNEASTLRICLDVIFGADAFESQTIIQSNKRGQTYQKVAKTHEYLFTYIVGRYADLFEIDKEISESSLSDAIGPYELWELRNRNPKFGKHNRPNLYYPIYVDTENLNSDGYAKVSLKPSSSNNFEVYPQNSEGSDSCWRWGKDKLFNSIADGTLNTVIAKQRRDGGWNVYEKSRKSSTKAKSIWVETAVINEQGTVEVGHLGFADFGFPKPTGLIRKVLKIGSVSDGIVLDHFAGSGTTGHAVISQNREDEGSRKYILVEMGDHFNTVLKPRIQKVIYSKDWNNGKPVSREGSSHLFKYIRLESYEDALNNLRLKRTPEQGNLLEQHNALREQYMLSYMLDVESAGSASLLNISAFADPFNYRMNIARSNETKETVVDFVETFNWLLGNKVLRISRKEHRTADFATDAEGRLVVKGRPRTCSPGEGWTFQEVEGETLSGDRVLIIWRTLTENPEQDNVMLDAWFSKRNYSTLDFEFCRIYVNGDNNLENLKIGEERWKVALIEEEFKRLMFDVEEV